MTFPVADFDINQRLPGVLFLVTGTSVNNFSGESRMTTNNYKIAAPHHDTPFQILLDEL